MAVEGAISLFSLFLIPSDPESAFLFGYSVTRWLTAGAIAVAVIVFAVLAVAAWLRPGWWLRLADVVSRQVAKPWRLFGWIAALFTVFLCISAIFILAISSAALELVILRSLLQRFGMVMIWVELTLLQFGLLIVLRINSKAYWQSFFTPLRLSLLVAIFSLVYVLALKVWATATWDLRMRWVEEYFFLPAGVFLVWGLVHHFFRDQPWYNQASKILLLVSIGVVTYTVYRHTADWMAWQRTPSKAYWPSLAESFLQGRLYLKDPENLHDLTFYNGKWYVPNPPLPALVLMPLVMMGGAENINTVLFSIVCGSINVVLVYQMLDRASRLGIIPTHRAGNLWLTVMFAVGTTHWWLSIGGRMWYMAQLLTLMFVMIAVLLTLNRASPWLVGVCLGLATLARPNAFTMLPFLAGIFLFFEWQANGAGRSPRKDEAQHPDRALMGASMHTAIWKRFFGWGVQAVAPLLLAEASLLYYNYLRFGNFFDFGYVNINSAEWLMNAVRTYGIFNIHFVPINFHAMFLKLPYIALRNGCLYYSPTREGISILAMTPAMIFIFRRLKLNWLTAGAWASVLFSVGLLLFYHNTGAWQLGYRYLMDFIPPALLLIAIGIGQRTSPIFKVLTLLSVLGNAAGIIWWFNKWWC